MWAPKKSAVVGTYWFDSCTATKTWLIEAEDPFRRIRNYIAQKRGEFFSMKAGLFCNISDIEHFWKNLELIWSNIVQKLFEYLYVQVMPYFLALNNLCWTWLRPTSAFCRGNDPTFRCNYELFFAVHAYIPCIPLLDLSPSICNLRYWLQLNLHSHCWHIQLHWPSEGYRWCILWSRRYHQ